MSANRVEFERPAEAEFPPSYAGYIGRVAAGGPVRQLHAQREQFLTLRLLPAAVGGHCYQEGKWSVNEVLGHLADFERVFAFRLVAIARGDRAALPGFDEAAWATYAPYRQRATSAIVDELIAVRSATILMMASLDAAAVGRYGTANDAVVSARALGWVIPGHTAHHFEILNERYQVEC